MKHSYRLIEIEKRPIFAGTLAIVASPAGLRRLYLPLRDARKLVAAIRRDEPDAVEDRRLLPQLTRELLAFFAGRRIDFTLPTLDFPAGTEFEREVWRACAAIPYGVTCTYGDLARAAERPGAARAVGSTMARNTMPIVVPCHRVTAAGGRLGGYSGPGGTEYKRQLLDMEARVAALEKEPKIYGFDKPYAWLVNEPV